MREEYEVEASIRRTSREAAASERGHRQPPDPPPAAAITPAAPHPDQLDLVTELENL